MRLKHSLNVFLQAMCLYDHFPPLSKVLNDMYIRFNHLLENLDQNWIDAQSFAEAMHSAGSLLDNCWGFIDGTLRPCCRPIRNSQFCFLGTSVHMV